MSTHSQEHSVYTQYLTDPPWTNKGFVLLPERWVVERTFAWTGRFRRLVRDYERLPDTLAGLHFLAFAILLLKHFVSLAIQSA